MPWSTTKDSKSDSRDIQPRLQIDEMRLRAQADLQAIVDHAVDVQNCLVELI